MSETPRIYVADLAAYNAGITHGIWIDATDDPDTIREDIEHMLYLSPVFGAEEVAIHDYEGFGGISLGEYCGINEALALAAFIMEHPDYGAALLIHWDEDIQQATQALEDYTGTYDSPADFAQDLTEDTTLIPEHLQHYIDYEAMARDMDMSGDIYTLPGEGGQVHIFWSR